MGKSPLKTLRISAQVLELPDKIKYIYASNIKHYCGVHLEI